MLFLLTSQPALASTVVFDQSSLGTSGVLCLDNNCGFADDFMLDGATWITDGHLYILDQEDVADRVLSPDVSLAWYVYEDNAGAPGSILASGSAVNRTYEPTEFGNETLRVFEYSFDLDAPLLLPGGTTFWFLWDQDPCYVAY